MGFFSDIMGAVSSWITAKGNVAELQYKHKIAVKENKRWRKGQWDRLFCSEDYNAIKLLHKFMDSDGDWIKIDDSLYDTLSSVKFCGLYKYDDVEIYCKEEKFPLFQIETRTKKSRKYYSEEETEYIRINPKIYPEFQKQFHIYQKKGMI